MLQIKSVRTSKKQQLTSSFLSHSSAWSILLNPIMPPAGCLTSLNTPEFIDGFKHLKGCELACFSASLDELLWLVVSMASSWALQSRSDDFLVSSLSFSVNDFRLERWSSLNAAMHSGFSKVLAASGSIEESKKNFQTLNDTSDYQFFLCSAIYNRSKNITSITEL